MNRTQVMKSVKKQVFRIFGRFAFFIVVIASMFHFGQSFSADSSSEFILEKVVISKHNEIQNEAAAKNNNPSEFTSVTGEEQIFITEGTSFYGLDERLVNKIIKGKTFVSQPQKRTVKRPVRKKTITNKPVYHTQSVTYLPEHNNVQHISLLAQRVCTVPGNHDQDFIFFQHIKYSITGYFNKHIHPNFHFLFFAISKNSINGGVIRPPPAYCEAFYQKSRITITNSYLTDV